MRVSLFDQATGLRDWPECCRRFALVIQPAEAPSQGSPLRAIRLMLSLLSSPALSVLLLTPELKSSNPWHGNLFVVLPLTMTYQWLQPAFLKKAMDQALLLRRPNRSKKPRSNFFHRTHTANACELRGSDITR